MKTEIKKRVKRRRKIKKKKRKRRKRKKLKHQLLLKRNRARKPSWKTTTHNLK